MRVPAMLACGGTFALAAASYACSKSPSEEANAVDAGGDSIDDMADAAISDEMECNPCFQFCACTPGATVFSAGNCVTYTCPASGVWGGEGCTGVSRCDAGDASDEQRDALVDSTDNQEADARPVVLTDASAADAAGDAPTDAMEDARDDALEASTEDASE